MEDQGPMTIASLSARPLRFALAAAVLIFALVLPAPSDAKRPPRKGGKVEVAWPKTKRGKPSVGLAKYLAKQVGAKKVKKKGKSASVPATFRQTTSGGSGTTATSSSSGLSTPLRLVRSFTIPTSDPAYARLLNLSFTYDSALAASALVATGDKAQAEQLLDQLKALQRTDGSIDHAFDTKTGDSDPRAYAGTIAWLGYAAETYREAYNSQKYATISNGVKNWLIANQMAANGLVRGTPNGGWASTIHNFMAWKFLVTYAGNTSGSASNEAQNAASKIQNGIDNHLTINDSSGLRFRQGLNDNTLALDAQTLGIIHLITRGRFTEAGRVADFMQSNFYVTGKKIQKSTNADTYNNTYSNNGPFVGYRPYAGVADVPDVIWMEGTLQAKLALGILQRSTTTLDSSIAKWRTVAGNSVAPLMANATVSNRFNEYHVWPASATASWLLINNYDIDIVF
jgi:hypothetical protein